MFTSKLPFLQITILTTLFHGSSPNCAIGRFGPSCEFKCLCQLNNCNSDGTCTTGTCMSGWFGPSCQYEDILNKYSINGPEWIKDGNDETCNHDKNDRTAVVVLSQSFHLPWMRIVVNDGSNILLFQLKFNGTDTPCPNMMIFLINPTTVDITCYELSNISEIEVSGKIVGSMCSLYVSGGRNMALSQSTIQSGGLVSDGFLHAASLAIDGDIGSNNKTCSQSSSPSSAGWLLTFTVPAVIYRVVMYNQFYASTRLKSFVLRTFYNSTKELETYTEPGENLNIYYVHLKNLENITRIVVSRRYVLMICEVETFGDSPCAMNKWGLHCTNNCHCQEDQSCFSVTGNCSHECPVGLYGHYCAIACSSNCADNICNDITGSCFTCIDGYWGDKCEGECEPGTYGNGCRMTCPENCNDICIDKIGNCLECGLNDTCFINTCINTNGSCYACDRGFYGEKCEHICSDNCVDKECDIKTGTCNYCKVGFYGINCENICPSGCLNRECYLKNGSCLSCKNGFYGDNCTAACSSNCLQRKCDFKDGHCLDCSSGYYGFSCQHQCPSSCVNHECFIVDGACAFCEPGFYGKNCTTMCSLSCRDQICNFDDGKCALCSDEFYGDDCSLLCPNHCKNRKCKSDTGNCYFCELGYYGQKCLNTCPENCQNFSCDEISGKCLSCKVGFYDNLCEHACPVHCLNETCDSVNGTCFDCVGGYYGNTCDTKCPITCPNNECYIADGTCTYCEPGFYGSDCSLKCPKNCKENICYRDSGTCVYCDNDLYGENCTMFCPQNCKNKACDIKTGFCLEGCENQFYGNFCSYLCSKKCKNRICDATEGSCDSCEVGYYGSFCKLVCSTSCVNNVCNIMSGFCTEGKLSPVVFSGILPIIVGLFMSIAIIVYICKQNTEETETEDT